MRPSTSQSDDGTNMAEIDQEGRALATNGRPLSLPYTVPIINQQACRHVREDFVNQMVKVLPDFFKDEAQLKKILSRAE